MKHLLPALAIGAFLAFPAFAAVEQPAAEGAGGAEAQQRRGFEVPGVRAIKDIVYGEAAGKQLKLDLYLPAEADESPRPLVVWIHGGGWQGGSKAQCPAQFLVPRGFIAASIEYRLTDVSPWPAQIHDCKGAIRWLRANAGKYGIDPTRIGVWGASAGGHLAAHLGTSAGIAEVEGDVGGNQGEPSDVQAVCNWFGPTDLMKLARDAGVLTGRATAPGPLMKLFGGPLEEHRDAVEQANPITFVDRGDAPFLIMHGDADRLVPLDQSRLLHTALEAAGVPTTLDVLEGSGHGNGGFMQRETLARVSAFFEEHLMGAGK